jgi:hypothetical protein
MSGSLPRSYCMKGVIVLAGSLAQKPGHGGHTWVFLQYLLGFQRLGWDVLFLDVLDPAHCLDEHGQPCAVELSWNLRYVQEVLERFGLGEAFALCSPQGEYLAGLHRAEVLARVARSAALINVMGFLRDEEILDQAPRRVFLDIDPGFGQMWKALHLADVFADHHAFVTIGENIGRPDCTIPTCDLHWITTPQPVVPEHWPVRAEAGGPAWTSVASWRGAYGPVVFQGTTYGLRVHEFRKFLELPRRSQRPFQLALDIHPAETRDRALLAEHGWMLVDPRRAAGDPWSYRAFIQNSRAEFLVAKNMYVQSQSGWFSDRSLCYLASGKPVLAQDTGLGHLYPTGEGFVTFTTPDEALAGVEAIERDYPRHARAARALAEEYFASDKVLSKLLTKLGLG